VMADRSRVLALSGGVGGAKLCLGLSRVLPPGALTIVANIGDDFEHLGLAISPDIDTLMYVLAGLDDRERGWGRTDETWTFMEALASLGGETWFQLGDGDLATHVERTRRLQAGERLSSITTDFCRRLGIPSQIIPATDDRVRTRVHTHEGVLDFQDYFVRRKCEPRATDIRFEGAAEAYPHPDFISALNAPELRAVVFCPSNPFISIDPILAIPGVRNALTSCRAPVIAVSPIIGGKAVKGPTAKIMAELGIESSAASVARHYEGLIDGYVLDTQDKDLEVSVARSITNTLMKTVKDRKELAAHVLTFAERVSAASSDALL